jgi:protein TonB
MAIGAHGGAWLALGALPPLDSILRAREVRVTLTREPEPPPEPEPPEPEPELEEPEPPPPEPPPEPIRRERRREDVTPDPTPAVETPEEPPPMEERIEDFTGTTLTSETATPGPAIIAGNGEAITGRVGAATGTTTGRARRGTADGAPGGSGDADAAGEAIVPIANLSRRPSAPSGLREALVRHYPPELRARGIEGEARVSFVLQPGGRLSRFRVVSESEDGFGRACREMLEESRGWDDPLDRDGNPVATRVSFTCQFSIRL